MKNKKLIKYYIPATILIICLICLIFPYRLLLIKNGYPFAKIQKDNIFQYIQTDNFRNKGIVVSKGKPVGWIYQGMTFGDTYFIPFKKGESPFDLEKDAAISYDERFKVSFRHLLFFNSCVIITLGVTFYFLIAILFKVIKKHKKIT